MRPQAKECMCCNTLSLQPSSSAARGGLRSWPLGRIVRVKSPARAESGKREREDREEVEGETGEH